MLDIDEWDWLPALHLRVEIDAYLGWWADR
jgi:hypothetical protein